MASDDQVERLGTTVVHLFRTLRAARRRMPRVHPAVEPMSYPVLYAVADCAPVRVSAVAARTFSDVSTVSRQVSELAGHGLIEKTTDPDDGRAQLLRLSPAGRELLTALNAQRNELFAGYVSAWDAAELDAFLGYLDRLDAAVAESDPGESS